MTENYPWLMQMLKDGLVKSSSVSFKSMMQGLGNRGVKKEELSMEEINRQRRVRQKIDLYTDNSQMPLSRSN
jgi:hypothetical protein